MEDSLFAPLLARVVRDPILETEWLDALSWSEFQLCKAVCREINELDLTAGILAHTLEEVSHAYQLKRAADRKRPKNFGASPNRFWPIFRFYLKKIADEVRRVGGEEQNYLHTMTWIIEQRAIFIFRTYARVSPDVALRRVLESLAGEEEGHVDHFDQFSFTPGLMENVRAAEESLWLETEAYFWRLFLDAPSAPPRFTKVPHDPTAVS